MTYRRVAGVTAAVLLIPFLLAGSDLTCPRHDREGGASLTATTTTESTDAHHHADRSSGQDTAPEEHHPLPGCCLAMSTCSSGAAIQSGSNTLTPLTSRCRAPAEVATLSLSRIESPDPPPPKA